MVLVNGLAKIKNTAEKGGSHKEVKPTEIFLQFSVGL